MILESQSCVKRALMRASIAGWQQRLRHLRNLNFSPASAVAWTWDFRASPILCTHEEMKQCINANDASYFSTEPSGLFRDFLQARGPRQLARWRPESRLGRLPSPAHRSNASRSTSSTPRGRYPVVEMIESCPDQLRSANRQRKGQGPGQGAKVTNGTNTRCQRNPKQSTELSRSLTPHLRTGGKRTTPSRFPAPVETMGCDTAKWKEMDPRVRDAYH